MRDTFTIKTSTLEDIKKYLNSFLIHNNEFIINDLEIAREIANKFLDISLSIYMPVFQAGSFQLLANTFKIGLKNNIITEDDFFTTDNEIIEKLKQSGNKEIIQNLSLIKINKIIEGTKEDHDFFTRTKARFIDPKILNNGNIKRLSELDNDFKQRIEDFKQKIEKGYYIKILRN